MQDITIMKLKFVVFLIFFFALYFALFTLTSSVLCLFVYQQSGDLGLNLPIQTHVLIPSQQHGSPPVLIPVSPRPEDVPAHWLTSSLVMNPSEQSQSSEYKDLKGTTKFLYPSSKVHGNIIKFSVSSQQPMVMLKTQYHKLKKVLELLEIFPLMKMLITHLMCICNIKSTLMHPSQCWMMELIYPSQV